MNPSKNLRERGVKVDAVWDGKQGAGAYGNRVRKAEAALVDAPEPAQIAPQRPPQVEDPAQAAIRKLWREGKRKEALSYGKK